MRFFETLSCLLIIPPIVLLLLVSVRAAHIWRRAMQATCLLVVLVLAIHMGYEGPHWQLLPLYLAALLLAVYAGSRRSWPRWSAVLAAVTCLLLVGLAVFFSWLMPMFRLPKPSGQYVVGTRIFHLVDSNRDEENGPSPSGKRELIVQAWYPAEHPSMLASHLAAYQRRKEVTLRASYRSVLKTNSYFDAPVRSGGPYPVVLYSPSWMGERTEGTFQMEELASHGFVVIGLDHTYFGGLVEFPDGRVADSHNAPQIGDFDHTNIEEQWELGGKYVRIEAQDNIFVLNQLATMNQDPTSLWFHQLDMSRVGVMGFSIGGAVAEQTAYQDPRIKAALDIDGWTFGDVASHGLAKPLMFIYEDKRGVLPASTQLTSRPLSDRMRWQFSVEDFAHVTDTLRLHGGFLLFIAGTHHVDFTDRSLLSPVRSLTGGGTLDPARAHAIINAYTLAFFSHFLNGKREALLDASTAPFPEVEFQCFSGSPGN
jgi:predicted dienelactone hydrolase